MGSSRLKGASVGASVGVGGGGVGDAVGARISDVRPHPSVAAAKAMSAAMIAASFLFPDIIFLSFLSRTCTEPLNSSPAEAALQAR
jgi:hypothetical protein